MVSSTDSIADQQTSQRGVKRSYFGRVDRELMQIKGAYEHLFITRRYIGVTVSWRFNNEGRLELINAKALNGRSSLDICPIMSADEASFQENLGRSYEVFLSPIPDDLIYTWGPKFVCMPRNEKYKEIVRYGGYETFHVMSNLNGGLFPASFQTESRTGQFHMPDITSDDFV